MASSNASKSSTPTARSGTTKSIKIKLKVPREILEKFPRDKPKSSEVSSPVPSTDAASPPANIKDEKPETNGDKVNGDDSQKKPAEPAKAGVKRDATAVTTTSKPRSRPGPKRRKIETEDQQPWTVTMTGPGAHKLGPKANQGAINAGLRALDRSGNPCRKWGKRTFNLKTFNGSEWSLHHWTAPPKPEVKEDAVENKTPSTNSDNHQPSSNVPSVTSQQPADVKDSTNAASPAVVAASA